MTPTTIPITTPLLEVPHYGQRVLVYLRCKCPVIRQPGMPGLV